MTGTIDGMFIRGQSRKYVARGLSLVGMKRHLCRAPALWENWLVALFAIILSCSAGQAAANANEEAEAAALCDSITALSPGVRPDEAQRLAICSYATANELRREYRVVGPPLFHNFLVNTGIRKRGLCFQWAEDLLARLDELKLATLELHWGEARAGTLREHNCIVVTAKGQPFRSGIVLDCWRHSGRLYWAPLTTDHYPWIEDSAYAQLTRSRRSPPAAPRMPGSSGAVAHGGGRSLGVSGG